MQGDAAEVLSTLSSQRRGCGAVIDGGRRLIGRQESFSVLGGRGSGTGDGPKFQELINAEFLGTEAYLMDFLHPLEPTDWTLDP